jgi:hypothetical protein
MRAGIALDHRVIDEDGAFAAYASERRSKEVVKTVIADRCH